MERHDEILNGQLDSLLPKDSSAGVILEILKDYCREKVYCHESVQRTELAGYAAIFGLLDKFGILLDCSAERFIRALDYSNKVDEKNNPIIIEKKLLRLFPEKYVKVYLDMRSKLPDASTDEFIFGEWNLRAHLIVDFISGMTDDFAMTTYRTLAGMRL